MCPIHQIGWYATYSDKFKNGILTNKDELVKPISSSLNSNNSLSNVVIKNKITSDIFDNCISKCCDEGYLRISEKKEINKRDDTTYYLENRDESSKIGKISVISNIEENSDSHINEIESEVNKKLHKIHFHDQRKSSTTFEVRYNVMNKNFIRTVKRKCRSLLAQYLENKGIKNSNCFSVKNNEQLACYLLENTSVKWSEVRNFNLETFSTYLMALSQYCKFKNYNKSKKKKEINKQVYSLLYSYSHTRFYKFINVQEVKMIIMTMKEIYGVKGLMKKITSSNKESYESHIGSLLRSIKINNY